MIGVIGFISVTGRFKKKSLWLYDHHPQARNNTTKTVHNVKTKTLADFCWLFYIRKNVSHHGTTEFQEELGDLDKVWSHQNTLFQSSLHGTKMMFLLGRIFGSFQGNRIFLFGKLSQTLNKKLYIFLSTIMEEEYFNCWNPFLGSISVFLSRWKPFK